MARPAKQSVNWTLTRTILAACCLSGLLAACSLNTPKPDQHLLDSTAKHWEAAPAATQARENAQVLSQWWQSWNDATLNTIQSHAQEHSPTLAQAAARIAQARADAAAAGAALWPSLNFHSSVTVGKDPLLFETTKQTTATAGLDARWEIDLFGAVSIARSGILANLQARENDWHDVRISLAAEVANTYVALRSCEAQTDLLQKSVQSQQLDLRLSRHKAEAGFMSPLELAQQAALLASAQNQARLQQGDCAILLKSLVVLSTLPEADLRQMLGDGHARLPQVSSFVVEAVPAKVLLKRPDIRAALNRLTASAAEIGVAEARRYPSVALTGSINIIGIRIAGENTRSTGWSFGPTLDLPLFDAGKRKAAVDNAEARYAEALAAFRQQSLLAVREVEEAMVRLDTTNQILHNYQAIEDANALTLRYAELGVQLGSVSVVEKEQVLRQNIASQQQKLQLQRDQASAWIALYKAVGGDWQAPAIVNPEDTVKEKID